VRFEFLGWVCGNNRRGNPENWYCAIKNPERMMKRGPRKRANRFREATLND